jgi:hypothetical protein
MKSCIEIFLRKVCRGPDRAGGLGEGGGCMYYFFLKNG